MSRGDKRLPARNDVATAVALAQWLKLWDLFTPDALQVLVDLQDDPSDLIQTLHELGVEPTTSEE